MFSQDYTVLNYDCIHDTMYLSGSIILKCVRSRWLIALLYTKYYYWSGRITSMHALCSSELSSILRIIAYYTFVGALTMHTELQTLRLTTLLFRQPCSF